MIKSIIYAEDSHSADIETVVQASDHEETDATFANERFRREMQYLVRFLDNRGALDVPIL